MLFRSYSQQKSHDASGKRFEKCSISEPTILAECRPRIEICDCLHSGVRFVPIFSDLRSLRGRQLMAHRRIANPKDRGGNEGLRGNAQASLNWKGEMTAMQVLSSMCPNPILESGIFVIGAQGSEIDTAEALSALRKRRGSKACCKRILDCHPESRGLGTRELLLTNLDETADSSLRSE